MENSFVKNMEKIPLQEKNIHPEALKTLEGMNELGSQAKVALLAVLLDYKPASLVETGLVHPSQLQTVRKRLEKLFSDFSLLYREDGIDYQNDPFVVLMYSVAKDNQSLERVKGAFSSNEGSNEYHEALGRAVGIPDSAVHGFVNGERLSQDEIRNNFSKEERALIFFIPSKDGWESERELLRKLAEEIKKVSPSIYAEASDRIKD